MALDFLRRDCSIMNDFFSKKNLRVLTIQETYEFVTDFSIRDEENHLASIFENVVNLRDGDQDKLAQVDDEVFKQMYIPRNIHELSIEDIYRMQKQGDTEKLDQIAKMTTFQSTLPPQSQESALKEPTVAESDKIDEESASESSESSEDD